MAAFKVLRGNSSAPCASCCHHRHHPHVQRKQARAGTNQGLAICRYQHRITQILHGVKAMSFFFGLSSSCPSALAKCKQGYGTATASYGYSNSATPDKLCPSCRLAQVSAAKHGQMLTWRNQMHYCANLMQTLVLPASQPQVSW